MEVGCLLGVGVGGHVHCQASTELVLKNGKNEETCQASVSPAMGGPEDDQIAVPLKHAQDLAALPGRASLIEITAPGSAKEITDYISSLQKIPTVSVRPIRQFTEGEAQIYERISGILAATVALVWVRTAVC